MTTDEPAQAVDVVRADGSYETDSGLSVPGGRLLGYALAWREALEIADAHRTRLRTAVLEDIAAGLSITEASKITGLSRVTLHEWIRDASDARRPPVG